MSKHKRCTTRGPTSAQSATGSGQIYLESISRADCSVGQPASSFTPTNRTKAVRRRQLLRSLSILQSPHQGFLIWRVASGAAVSDATDQPQTRSTTNSDCNHGSFRRGRAVGSPGRRSELFLCLTFTLGLMSYPPRSRKHRVRRARGHQSVCLSADFSMALPAAEIS